MDRFAKEPYLQIFKDCIDAGDSGRFRHPHDAQAMNRKNRSYLELTAIAEVGAVLLDPRPALLWSADARHVLWANAAAVRLFGMDAVETLLGRDFSPANPAVRQIVQIARRLPLGGPPRLEMLRLSFGVRSDTQPFLCRRVRIGDDSGVLTVGPLSGAAATLADRAGSLAQRLATETATVAVLDPAGRVIGASEGFADLAGGAAALEELGRAFADSGRAAMKRKTAFGLDTRLVGLAAATTPDGRLTLAVIGPAEAQAAEPAPAPQPAARVEPPAPTPAAPAEPVAQAPAAEPAEAPAAVDPAPGAPAAAEAQQPAAPEPVPEPEATAPPAPVAAAPAQETAASPEAAPASPPEDAAAEPHAEPGGFVFYPRLAPIRFVFQIDARQRFSFVSPEFAAVVGPAAADIVGRSWSEVAAARGLDPDGSVEKALVRRDTWSGVTVYWPVDGKSLAVAVDLAALPAFNRDRTFEGFRGFGVCRTTDTRPLGAATEEAKAAPAEEPPAAAGRTNVVRLPGVDAEAKAPLSGNEQDAFRRIADALKAVIPRRPSAADAAQVGPREVVTPQPAAEPAAPETAALPPLHRRLLDRVPVGVLVFRERDALFANRFLLDLLGYDGVVGINAAGGVDTLFPAGLRQGENNDRATTLRRRGAPAVAVEARLNSIPWEDGTALMLSIRELPGPDPAVQASAARIAELETILDTATDGVIVIDREARIVSVNRSAQALFGIEARDVVGSPFQNLLAEESRKSALDYLDGLAQNGVASVLNDGREVIGNVPAGGLIPLFMTMGRLGETDKFCAVLRDLSQWKNAEEELVAARRAAEQANNQKSEFLAKISHEIRTPLNAVIGFSEVMLEEQFGPIANERYRDYLRDIHLSGTHLLSLINDLLDLSKVEAGKLDLAFSAVDVNVTIQDCVSLMQPQANRERIIIRTSLAAGVPKVVADPRSLRQIILNLLSNAVKFTLAGGQVIVSSTLEDSGEVVIRIRDTGIGMSAKDLETALKPFQQLTTPGRSRFDGTGLGLPLTKALVEANRAGFAIDSTPNQGTLVRITFPNARVLAG